jgi:putative addiction module component (TIGR02574 family)
MGKPALNIGDLSPEERLRQIEELWDSLEENPGTVPLTNAQREELDRRLDDLAQELKGFRGTRVCSRSALGLGEATDLPAHCRRGR